LFLNAPPTINPRKKMIIEGDMLTSTSHSRNSYYSPKSAYCLYMKCS